MFNPEAILNSTTTEAFETRRQPIPPGEYEAIVKEVKLHELKDKETGATRSDTLRLEVIWGIEDEDLFHTLNRSSVTVVQSLFVDLNGSGGLANGKDVNIGLGQLRSALGQNKPGQWSINQLIGAGPALLAVDIDTYQSRSTGEDIETNRVRRVTST